MKWKWPALGDTKTDWRQTRRYLIWIGSILLILFIASAILREQRLRTIQNLRIEFVDAIADQRLINEKDVQLMLDRAFAFPLVGQTLEELDLGRVEDALESDAFVHDADVFVDAKTVLQIRITQRVPILRVLDAEGKQYYLGPDGVQMNLSNHFTSRVLTATGNIPPFEPDFIKFKQHTVKDLFQLSHLLKEHPFFSKFIEQIYVDSKREYHLSPKIGDHTIAFGNYEQAEDKLENLYTFYTTILPREGWRKYKKVSVKYDGQVVGVLDE